MQIDLDALSRQELETLRRDVDKALSTAADRDRKRAIAAMEKAAAEYGYSVSDLAGGTSATRKKTGSKTPPKYRNPEDPDQTWSGRGRKPRWIVEAESAGRPISDFAI
ncbi:H-NS family nucleoid-associated regulatory protein [Pseudoroseicyclus aestuarii]|uniref:DNA-binding protein H-NS n=1 Tax=Pseudoroseicyclus aestuarii TaxID=1795041 RepID=A0A318T3I1_9RHOB|nr:H-NS histone family protein [Pseudoroseicyclus aestuarii]PYE84764.1 DNA-binding protein H-NS [Pseudoroseicyclus aestuarii]